MDIESLLPLNDKARESISNCGFLTAWEGSVRSAKTTVSVYALLMEIIKSPDNRHLMLGRSQAAVMANCVDSDFGLIDLACGAAKIRTDKTGETYVDVLGKRIDLFGGEHVSSFKAFRGRTYGMVYVDEANLQHKNTIAECFNRTIASKSRKHFFTLNPDIPSHWMYKDYLDKFRDSKMPGYRWFHFTLDDNPALTEERKAELRGQFPGIFYDRFILGKRVRAEGIIYRSFVNNKQGDPGNVLYDVPKGIYRTTFGLDFGGNTSATKFTCTGWFLKDKQLCIATLAELKIVHKDNDLGVGHVIAEWKSFYARCASQWPVDRVFADSAEQLIIKSMRELPGMVRVENAMKRPIIDRIRAADLLYAQGRKLVMHHCKDLIAAIESAVWDDKATGESRLDDGSIDVDSLDADEYSWERDLTQLVEGGQR